VIRVEVVAVTHISGPSFRSEGSIKGSIPTARWRLCKCRRQEKPRFAGFLQSPLTDSNRRPPCDPNGNRWQPVATVRPRSSHFRAAGGRNVCQQLRPLCSIPVPCQSAKNGPSKRREVPGRLKSSAAKRVATSDHGYEPLAVRGSVRTVTLRRLVMSTVPGVGEVTAPVQILFVPLQ
jgi:hypothetical protein